MIGFNVEKMDKFDSEFNYEEVKSLREEVRANRLETARKEQLYCLRELRKSIQKGVISCAKNEFNDCTVSIPSDLEPEFVHKLALELDVCFPGRVTWKTHNNHFTGCISDRTETDFEGCHSCVINLA